MLYLSCFFVFLNLKAEFYKLIYFVSCYVIIAHRRQIKCDELNVKSEETEKKYGQLERDRRDVINFLKKSLESREEEIADLTDRLSGLQQVCAYDASSLYMSNIYEKLIKCWFNANL